MLEKIACKNYKEVEEKVKNMNKDVLLIFGSTTCPPCKQLENMLNSFETDKDLTIINIKRPIFEDMEVFKEMYGLTSFPTLVVADKDLKKKTMVVGYKGEEEFEDFVDSNFK